MAIATNVFQVGLQVSFNWIWIKENKIRQKEKKRRGQHLSRIIYIFEFLLNWEWILYQ